MKEKLEKLKEQVIEKLDKINSLESLDELRVSILGKKGELTSVMKEMGNVAAEKRAEFGKTVNEVKEKITGNFETKLAVLKEKIKEEKLKNEIIDITLPGRKQEIGTIHPITQTLGIVKTIFAEMGFDMMDGPEIEKSYYNFDALNFPKDHPSRDLQDTFYINDDLLLRTHTSPMQIRYMLEKEPPFRMISLGKVYRSDYDITHTPMFHQIEGLMIGENVSFSNFKALLTSVVRRIFGEERAVRFRPHFFPFTEPSAEMDVECGVCHGKGCRSCKNTGWLEILGSGMVDPNVLKEVGLDPTKYQGFAFGMGIERVAMLKFGIDDIRAYYENDVRFLEQFK